MALTRKFLSALGIESDKVDEIIAAHTETTDSLKEQLKVAQEAAAKLPKVEEQLNSYKEAAKNGGDYEALKKQFDDFKAEVAEREVKEQKKGILSKIARDAGLSEAGIAKVLKYTDYSAIELDEKGEPKDGKALLKSIKEEWPEYIQTTSTEGVKTPNPPQNNGGKVVKTKDEILAITDTAERQAAWREYLDAQRQKG